MALLNWEDTTLALPSSLEVNNQTGTVRKKMENGRTFQRSRYEKGYETGKVNFRFLGANFQIFKGVWKHYLDNGTQWFYMDLPVGGSTLMTNCKVRFISDYSYRPISPYNVNVSANIEFYEVTTPDELALGNLIDVGSSNLYPDAEVFEIVFTNDALVGKDAVVAVTHSTQTYNNAVQWWDGTLITTGPYEKVLPTTVHSQNYRCQFWSCASSSDSTPASQQPDRFVMNITDGAYLKYFDPNQHGVHWTMLDFNNCKNWEPGFGKSDSLQIEVSSSDFFAFNISNNPHLVNLTVNVSGPGYIGGNGVSLANMSNLASVNFTHETPATLCHCRDVSVTTSSFDNGNSGHVDWSNVWMRPATLGDNSYPVTCTIRDNSLITKLTLGKLDDRVNLELRDNPNLSTLVFVDATNEADVIDLRDCNFSVADLKAFIDTVTAQTAGYSKEIRVDGNPCWVGGALDPGHADTASVLASAVTQGFTIVAS